MPSDNSVSLEGMTYDGPVALNVNAEGAGHGESMNHPAVWNHIKTLLDGDWDQYEQGTQELEFFKVKP